MIVTRWQADMVPTLEQMNLIFRAESLKPEIEEFAEKTVVEHHRHPFDEVRMIVEGEMIMDISGNKVLLRPGDRIDIPSNTKHSMAVHGGEKCVCICAKKPF